MTELERIRILLAGEAKRTRDLAKLDQIYEQELEAVLAECYPTVRDIERELRIDRHVIYERKL